MKAKKRKKRDDRRDLYGEDFGETGANFDVGGPVVLEAKPGILKALQHDKP